jgi:hypothetical protein
MALYIRVKDNDTGDEFDILQSRLDKDPKADKKYTVIEKGPNGGESNSYRPAKINVKNQPQGSDDKTSGAPSGDSE